MPAKSIAQQKLFALALAYKRGEVSDVSDEVKELSKMPEDKLKDYAKTKHDGLPKKVESFKEWVELEERTTIQDIKKLMAKTVCKNKYKCALDILKQIVDRKKKEGKLKHDMPYYAAQVAKQISGVDARELADMMNESIEIQELSTRLLKKYADKSTADQVRMTWDGYEKNKKKIKKRIKGMAKAQQKVIDRKVYGESIEEERIGPFMSKLDVKKGDTVEVNLIASGPFGKSGKYELKVKNVGKQFISLELPNGRTAKFRSKDGSAVDVDAQIVGKVNEAVLEQAEYEGRKVKLNEPFRLPSGSKKKFAVYVKNDKGNVVKVQFGDPNMEIKRDDPERRKAFRARHGCDKDPGPKWKAKYWSCYQWRAGAEVDD